MPFIPGFHQLHHSSQVIIFSANYIDPQKTLIGRFLGGMTFILGLNEWRLFKTYGVRHSNEDTINSAPQRRTEIKWITLVPQTQIITSSLFKPCIFDSSPKKKNFPFMYWWFHHDLGIQKPQGIWSWPIPLSCLLAADNLHPPAVFHVLNEWRNPGATVPYSEHHVQ